MSTEDRLDELERYYKQQLILLQESYNKAAEPYLKTETNNELGRDEEVAALD